MFSPATAVAISVPFVLFAMLSFWLTTKDSFASLEVNFIIYVLPIVVSHALQRLPSAVVIVFDAASVVKLSLSAASPFALYHPIVPTSKFELGTRLFHVTTYFSSPIVIVSPKLYSL